MKQVKGSLKKIKPPEMLLGIYSPIVLGLDLITLLVGIWFAILVACYRTFKPPPLKSLNGEVAMVIGAGRGVKRQVAIQPSLLGVDVACVDINPENCESTAQRACQLSGVARPYICDVTDQKQVAQTVNDIKAELGQVTMLLHCCGVPSPRSLQDPPEIRKTMEMLVLSHFWLLDSVVPGMQRAGKGHIVLLSSVAGSSSGATRGGGVALSAAQFAVQGLAESLHTELRQSNSNIIITLIHVYPFIVGAQVAQDLRLGMSEFISSHARDTELLWHNASDGSGKKNFGWSAPELCGIQRSWIFAVSWSHLEEMSHNEYPHFTTASNKAIAISKEKLLVAERMYDSIDLKNVKYHEIVLTQTSPTSQPHQIEQPPSVSHWQQQPSTAADGRSIIGKIPLEANMNAAIDERCTIKKKLDEMLNDECSWLDICDVDSVASKYFKDNNCDRVPVTEATTRSMNVTPGPTQHHNRMSQVQSLRREPRSIAPPVGERGAKMNKQFIPVMPKKKEE